MDRSDFLERGELKVDFLKYYRLVSRWACKENNISISDLELLFYLDPIAFMYLFYPLFSLQTIKSLPIPMIVHSTVLKVFYSKVFNGV